MTDGTGLAHAATSTVMAASADRMRISGNCGASVKPATPAQSARAAAA
jgi:hypothetical protein